MKWSNDQIARYGVVFVWLLIVSIGWSGIVAPFALPEQIYEYFLGLFSDALYQHELKLATSPIANVSHRILGLLFLVIGMAQFNSRLRAKNPALHRWCGRLYIVLGLLIAVTGIILAVRHAFAGQLEQIGVLFFSALFGLFVTVGLVQARRRNFVAHREYMIRGFATTLTIVVHRLFFASGVFLFDLPEQAIFLLSAMVALTVCITAAEIWIDLSRRISYAPIAN